MRSLFLAALLVLAGCASNKNTVQDFRDAVSSSNNTECTIKDELAICSIDGTLWVCDYDKNYRLASCSHQ
jgi:uncharacterized lipoprotein YajG